MPNKNEESWLPSPDPGYFMDSNAISDLLCEFREEESVRSPPPPLPQYDLLLSADHPTYRTVANAVFDNEVRPKYRRIRDLNVGEMVDDLHEALKKHMGEFVPRPTVWVGDDKAPALEDRKPDTMMQTFMIGTVGKQAKPYTVCQASDKYFIEKDHKKGNGRPKRAKVLQEEALAQQAKESEKEIASRSFDEVASSTKTMGEHWSIGSGTKKVCFAGFREDLRKIKEWRQVVFMYECYPGLDPSIGVRHKWQLERLFVELVEKSYRNMESRALALTADFHSSINIPSTSDDNGSVPIMNSPGSYGSYASNHTNPQASNRYSGPAVPRDATGFPDLPLERMSGFEEPNDYAEEDAPSSRGLFCWRFLS